MANSNHKSKNQDALRMFMGKYGIGVILFFMLIIISIMKPRFIYPSNVLNILTQISVNCLIAYGMCLAITTGGIDLSVGSQLALVSCLLGQFIVNMNMNVFLACILAALAAAASKAPMISQPSMQTIVSTIVVGEICSPSARAAAEASLSLDFRVVISRK